MNSFAKGLFQLLIGWVRNLTALWDGDWTRLDSFFDWVTRHWLFLAVVLILVGSAVDVLLWLLRWRPDIAWRVRWKRLRSFSVSGYLHELRFRRGYDQDNTQIMEAARPIAEMPVPGQEPVSQASEAAVHPADVIGEREQLESDLGVVRHGRLLDTPVPEDAPERRRRSERYRLGLRGAVHHFRKRLQEEEEEEYEPDVLPPIMSKEEAFRAPVYPGGQRGRNGTRPGGEEN